MCIPESWIDRDGLVRPYHQRISPDSLERFTFHDGKLTVLYETPLEDCSYGCTPGDVSYLLSKVPARDLTGLVLLAFRQPTRKQQIINPVWGRLLYDADFGRFHGPAIVLEAVDMKRPLRWPKKLDIEAQKELQRHREDGHLIESTKREHVIHMSEEALRQKILYRTLLHEVGHWVHWLTSVVRPETMLSPIKEEAATLYFAKPQDERENFAHTYANRLATKLRAKQIIPFATK